ncbi:MAG: tetratricopeptide repeat protein [Candidatus Kapabacteria bacterium]|jgi:tetratricopeptide (TPR) repeat protein|nr:tetratricopeptide repeat protein [Candidatus Kapabacteria bacterium]
MSNKINSIIILLAFTAIFSSANLRADTMKDAMRAYKNQDYLTSTQLFTEVLDKDKTNLKALYYRGMAALYTGNPGRTVNDFDYLIEKDPKNPDYYNSRGLALANMEEVQKSINDFSKAIKLDPKHAQAYLNRATAYLALDKFSKAIKDVNKSIKLQAANPDNYYQRGQIYYKKKQYKKSIKDYNKALSMGFNFPDLYYHRGNSYFQAKTYKKAIKDYTIVLKIEPERMLALNNRAMAYEKTGQHIAADLDRQKMEDIKDPTRNYPPAENVKLKRYTSKDGRVSLKLPVGWHLQTQTKKNITEMLITKSKLKRFDEYFEVGVRISLNTNTMKSFNLKSPEDLQAMLAEKDIKIKNTYLEHTVYQKKTFNDGPWVGLSFLEVLQPTVNDQARAVFEYTKVRENVIFRSLFQTRDRLFDYYKTIFDKSIKSLIVIVK